MSVVITTRVDPQTLAIVDRVAGANGRSRSWFAARAIERAARDEAAFLASLDEAETQIADGDFLSQREMEDWLEAKIAKRVAAA